jgi:hypothetical protein
MNPEALRHALNDDAGPTIVRAQAGNVATGAPVPGATVLNEVVLNEVVAERHLAGRPRHTGERVELGDHRRRHRPLGGAPAAVAANDQMPAMKSVV